MSFFKRPDYKDNPYPKVEAPSPFETKADVNDVYTIGNNITGDTIVRLTSGPTSMILTLTPPEVNRMVRLLLASLEEDEIEDDNKD